MVKYISELPDYAVEIKRIYELEVQPNKYFFDPNEKVIIRKCVVDPFPYAIIQGPTFQPVLKSRAIRTRRVNLDDLIEHLYYSMLRQELI